VLVGPAQARLAQAHDQVAHHFARLRRDGAIGDVVDVLQPHILGIGQQGGVEADERGHVGVQVDDG
jgi:hypothetical protein